MAAFTAKATGNWSSGGQTTWNEVGVPGDGDTVTIGAFTVTVDVNTTIGTSPNNATTVVVDKTSATGALIIGTGVTFTVKGNLGGANGNSLVMSAGSTLTFDNSGSGGSPVYTFVNGGFQKFTLNGSSSSGCVIQAISGQTWKMHGNPDHPTTATYTTFRRSTSQTLTCVGGATLSFTNCTWDTCGRWNFAPGSGTDTMTFVMTDCIFTSSTDASDSIAIQYQTAASSGTRSFMRNVLDKGITWNSKSFTVEKNYMGGPWNAVAGSTGNTIRHNFFYSDGSGNNGNGQLFETSLTRNYFVVANGGNPHFINATAKSGADTIVSQNIFEAHAPEVNDFGDAIIIQGAACSGGNKIISRNNIVLPANYSGVTSGSGTLTTLYDADANVLTEFYRNTGNVDDHDASGKRAMFAVGEAGSGGVAGQLAVLKSNLAWGSSSDQGYLAERVSGNVKDVITASGADRNWVYNTSAGDNLRGYNDLAASNTMWTAGNASAAGVDANQGSGNPSFVDSSRNIATWCNARGYGAATSAAALLALQEDVTRIPDLINYIFEGFKVQNASMRNAAHDGGVAGAANFHKSTRTLSNITAFRTYINSQYGISV